VGIAAFSSRSRVKNSARKVSAISSRAVASPIAATGASAAANAP
jgi:hypothetical protein